MKPAKLGEEVTVSAKALKIGKHMSFLNVDFHDSKGNLLVQGKHTKSMEHSPTLKDFMPQLFAQE